MSGTACSLVPTASALVVATGLLLTACSDGRSPGAADETTAAAAASTARPTPRYPDGTVRFDAAPDARGYWGRASVSSLFEAGVDVEMDAHGRLANLADAPRVAPFRPWALALYEHRQRNDLADDPTRFCLPPAGPRHLHADGGFRIVQDRNYDRIYVLFGGGNRNWRLIHMDGRAAPDPAEVVGTYYGYSSGSWQGDELVVESTGFNARFWFSNGGLPHTEALHLTERFSRPDFDTLAYDVTIDDPLTYTRPWTARFTVEWVDGGEIAEQFCED